MLCYYHTPKYNHTAHFWLYETTDTVVVVMEEYAGYIKGNQYAGRGIFRGYSIISYTGLEQKYDNNR